MRILLDESVPGPMGRPLVGHEAISVQKRGWSGVKNGKLLALAAAEFDVLLTADKGIEYQQNLQTLPIAVLIVLAKSNRMKDLAVAISSRARLCSLRQCLRRTDHHSGRRPSGLWRATDQSHWSVGRASRVHDLHRAGRRSARHLSSQGHT